ncbi:MAG: serine hydrolase [Gemmatimonadaceae bacterium]
MRSLLAALLLALPSSVAIAQRGNVVPSELPTKWEPPPGDGLEHAAAGFAKVLCSAIFIAGRSLKTSADEDGYFVSAPEERRQMRDTIVDRAKHSVTVTLPNGVKRTARQFGGQGCVTLPRGKDSVFFVPKSVPANLPPASATPWPMGDVLPSSPLPPEIDRKAVEAAVNAAFPDGGLTAAFVVTYKGRIIAERYDNGATMTTPLPGWSMGKSVTATLMSQLIEEKAYDLWQQAPVDEWQKDGDVRRTIRIADIFRMSSGLRFPAPQDPDYDRKRGYPDHLYVYTGAVDGQQWAVTRPPQWPPNTVGRYRNSDPLTLNYLVRKAVDRRHEDYLTYPQRHLFDRIGVRGMILETDPYGHFLLQGYEHAPGRDWARLGMLWLQDGMWDRRRILPVGMREFARTPAPAWAKPQYGGMFWLNRLNEFPIPRDAFYMAGVGGQYTIIIPSHEMVVVRLGHFKGATIGEKGLAAALAALMRGVPEQHPVWDPPRGSR